MKLKKIAIFHNFMDNIGGAEMVDLILAKELKADFYSTNIDREKIRKMGFSSINLISIGSLPFNPPWRQELAYWKFRQLNLGKQYDYYIIAGDWAMAAGIKNHPNLWYVYSPTREVWDLYDYTRKNLVVFWQRPLFDLWVKFRRYMIKKDLKNIDKLVVISKNVATRVKKYLGRDSVVIYPPVETAKFHYRQNGNFWLSVNRLIPHKRVEMQINSFAKMPEEKLVIVGSYEKARHFQKYAGQIKKIKPANVEILSWVDQKKLLELYADCKGFIATSLDEDFGLGPVEAMASGKPVIAPNEGGYKETVISGQTGLLIDNINEEKLIQAVKSLGINPGKYKQACLVQAKKFDSQIFIEKIKAQIK